MVDMVNNPPHYKQGAIECIEAIRAALTPEEFRGYCKGNSIKYVWRELHKGGDESLKKAVWYMLQIGERATAAPDSAFAEPAAEVEWPADDSRVDIVASSHGDGEHYAYTCQFCHKMISSKLVHVCQ